MPQIGNITKYNIPVFERSDVQEPAFSVYVNGQWGRVNLVPYPQRDKPAICCEIDGDRYGSSVSINKIIDGFEDGDNAEYYIPSSSGNEYTSVGRDLTSGSDRGLVVDGPVDMRSMPGDGLPYYPVQGDTFEFYVRPIDFEDTPAFWRMNFGTQGYGTNNLYRVEWESEPTPGSDLSFEKRAGGTNVIRRASADDVGCRTGRTYRIEVNWGSDGSNTMTCAAYDMSGDQVSPADGSKLTFSDAEYTNGGIHWEANGYMVAAFDTCRTLPQ